MVLNVGGAGPCAAQLNCSETTSWMRCGWPGWPSGGCYAPASCRRPGSGRCGISPGPDRPGLGADPVLQRAGELLEGALVKITSVVIDGMKAKSAMAMVAALIAGERDPREIADLAKGPLRGKRDQLAEAGRAEAPVLVRQ